MTPLLNSDGVSFHDAGLVDSLHSNDRLYLKFEYQNDSDDDAISWSIVTITNIENITRSDTPIDTFAYDGDFGSVLDLAWDGQDLVLTLNWIKFATKEDVFHYYRITGQKLRATVSSCGKETSMLDVDLSDQC